MDLFFIALALVFFAMSWSLVSLCDRLMAGTEGASAHKS